MQTLPNVAGSSDIWSKSAGGQGMKLVKLAGLVYMEFCLNSAKLSVNLISLRSGRTWIGSHNCAIGLSLVQSFFSCCHAIPTVLSAGNYPFES